MGKIKSLFKPRKKYTSRVRGYGVFNRFSEVDVDLSNLATKQEVNNKVDTTVFNQEIRTLKDNDNQIMRSITALNNTKVNTTQYSTEMSSVNTKIVNLESKNPYRKIGLLHVDLYGKTYASHFTMPIKDYKSSDSFLFYICFQGVSGTLDYSFSHIHNAQADFSTLEENTSGSCIPIKNMTETNQHDIYLWIRTTFFPQINRFTIYLKCVENIPLGTQIILYRKLK